MEVNRARTAVQSPCQGTQISVYSSIYACSVLPWLQRGDRVVPPHQTDTHRIHEQRHQNLHIPWHVSVTSSGTHATGEDGFVLTLQRSVLGC